MNEPGHGTPIPGTAAGARPFFSPDGEWVAFVDDTARVMRRVSLSTNEIFTLGDGDGGAWADDGSIIFTTANDSGLWRMQAIAVGGEPELKTLRVFHELHRVFPIKSFTKNPERPQNSVGKPG